MATSDRTSRADRPSTEATDLSWSFKDTPAPEPAYMPAPSPEQAAEIRARVDKLEGVDREARDKAVAEGMAAGKRRTAEREKAEADAIAARVQPDRPAEGDAAVRALSASSSATIP